MSFKELKIGDRVDRYHGSGFFMEMEVVDFRDGLIVCAAVNKNKETNEETGLFRGDWTFDPETGMEEDADLGWGVKFGITGTYLKDKS